MSSPSTELPILIIGGGIAGLSLACTLHQTNIPFEVFESLSPDHSTGYGISLLSWAYQPLLDVIGKDDQELRHKTATDSLVGGLGRINTYAYNGYTGEELFNLGERKAGSVFRANRSLLRKFFLEDIPEDKVHFETTLSSVARGEDDSVLATFASGYTVRGSLLVAADGVNSTVRKLLHPEIKPTYTSATVLSSELHLSKDTFDARIGPHMHSSNATLSFGENFMIGAHNVLIDAEDANIGWTYSYPTSDESAVIDPETAPKPLSRPEITSELTALRKDMSEPYSTLLSDEVLAKSSLHNWPMRSVRTPLDILLSTLEKSGIVFIGDAAHAMPIFAGEGGNHGLLDGVELGLCLTDSNNSAVDSRFAAIQWYKSVHARWQEGVDRSEERLGSLHKPIAEWEKLASMMKAKTDEAAAK